MRGSISSDLVPKLQSGTSVINNPHLIRRIEHACAAVGLGCAIILHSCRIDDSPSHARKRNPCRNRLHPRSDRARERLRRGETLRAFPRGDGKLESQGWRVAAPGAGVSETCRRKQTSPASFVRSRHRDNHSSSEISEILEATPFHVGFGCRRPIHSLAARRRAHRHHGFENRLHHPRTRRHAADTQHRRFRESAGIEIRELAGLK